MGRILGESDEVSRELKLLVDRCEVLVAQRASTINWLRWRVPGSETPRCGCSSMASLLFRNELRYAVALLQHVLSDESMTA